jgi:hypothetical protein
MNNVPMAPLVLLEVRERARRLVRDWRDVSVDVRFGMFCYTVIQSSFRIVILMQVTPYDTKLLSVPSGPS